MLKPSRDRWIPLLCLAGAVVFWGTSFVATKTALDSFSPMTVIWLRMAIASAVFAPFWSRLPKPDRRPGDVKWIALLALLQPCIYYLAEGYAVRYTTSSQAGVISAIVPLLVAAGAAAFLGEKLTARSAVAIVVSLAGVAMLSVGGSAQASAPNPLLGNVLEVLAMTSAAASMLTIKHLSDRYNPWIITGLQAGVGAVFFLPGVLIAGVSGWAQASAASWFAVAYLGVVVSLLAFGLYNTAVTRMPASRAALSINLVPAVALLAGWLLRGESLTALQLLACVVIVGAVIVGESGGEASEPAATPAAPAAHPAPHPALEPSAIAEELAPDAT